MTGSLPAGHEKNAAIQWYSYCIRFVARRYFSSFYNGHPWIFYCWRGSVFRIPMIYSAAGKSKVMSPGVAIAAVSTIGYLGFLFGPPFIGFIAQATSLRISFGLIAVMGSVIAVIATRNKF